MKEQNHTSHEVSAEDLSSTRRLDAVLTAHLPDHVSRSQIQSLIKAGQVTINGKPASAPNTKLSPGDVLTLEIPEPDEAEPLPEDIPLDILFEDEHLIILNKPPGMVVHPAPGNWSGTLVNAILHHCPQDLTGIGGVKRPGIVHRLDKDTSGIMVVAKTQETLLALQAQFADHGKSGPLERAYLALVWGALAHNTGKIDAPLGRSSSNRLKRAVVSRDSLDARPDARHAVTHYTVKRHLDGKGDGITNASLVECRLETGRTHQIRVHMAHLGHPLIGDQDYGKHFQTKAEALEEPARSAVKAFRRQALHAHLLGIEHPVTGEHLRYSAPLPADFSALLESFDTGNK